MFYILGLFMPLLFIGQYILDRKVEGGERRAGPEKDFRDENKSY